MINGLNYNGFEQLNGLHLLYADEIQIDKIDQKEINTLDNINTETTIQEQIDNLDLNLSENYYSIKAIRNKYYDENHIDEYFLTIASFDGYKEYINNNYYTQNYINNNFYNKNFIDSLATGSISSYTLNNYYDKSYIDENFTTINSFDIYKEYVFLTYYTALYINNNYYTQSYINSNFYNKSTIDTYNINNNNNTLIYINNNFYSKLYIDSLFSNINSNFYSKLYIDNEFQIMTSKFAEIPINYYSKVYIDKELQIITSKFSEIPNNYYDKTYINTQYETLSGYITYLNEYITSVDLNLIDFYVTYDYLANTYDNEIKTWSSNQFNQIYTKTEIDNQNLTLSDYITTNYTNLSNHVAANYYSINAIKNRYYDQNYIDSLSGKIYNGYYNKTYINNQYTTISNYIVSNKSLIDSLSGTLYTKYYDASYIDLEIYKVLADKIDVYHYTKNDINYKFITISDYITSNYDTLSGFISSNKLDVTAINNAKDGANTAASSANSAASSANSASSAANSASSAANSATTACTVATTACTAATIACGVATGLATAAALIPGPMGPMGPQGGTGPRGNDGNDGSDGKDGDKGDKGDAGDSYFTKTGTIVSLANSSLQVLDAFSFPLVNLSNSSFTSSYFDTDVLFKKNITLSGSLTQNGSYMDYYTNGNSHRFYNITAGIVTKKLCEINEDYFQHHGNYASMACQPSTNKKIIMRTDVTNYSSIEFLSNLGGVQLRDAGIDCVSPITNGYQDGGGLLISARTISVGTNPNGTANISLNAPYITIGNNNLSEIYITGTLFYNGERLFSNNRYSNATEFNEYITQV
jgi:D-ribose pyranose/furanose isomerase RbsD